MRVKLVNGIFGLERLSEPMGLCFLAAVLRPHGHQVEIIEPRLHGYTVEATARRLLETPCDVVGVSSFSFQRDHIFRLAKLLRREGFRGKIVFGGLGPTLSRDTYFEECPEIDIIVLGEGEYTFLDLARSLEAERDGAVPPGAWRQVPGLCYKDDSGGVRVNTGRSRVRDLDTIPFMARDILEQNIAKYGTDMIFAPIMAGRGCYEKCAYCWIIAALEFQEGKAIRQRSVANILDEVELLSRKYGIRHFSFEDDNFILPGPKGLERAAQFRDEVKRRNLEFDFFFQTRPDTITREALALYKEAGLKKLFIGIEAVADEVIDLYNRNCSLERVEETLAILKEMGFDPSVSREHEGRLRFGFITFNPFTTVRSFKLTVEFFKKHRLTPKRLVTRVKLFDGDMAIKRAYEEKGITLSDDDHPKFQDPRVAAIYGNLKQYSSRVFSYREQIRGIEKHIARKRIPKREILHLYRCREHLDGLIYGFSDLLIEVAESGDSLDDRMAERFRTLLEAELLQLEAYVQREELPGEIHAADEKYAVTADMHDLYW